MDYYETLGVGKNASADEIKAAFRKKAHQYHPDKTGGNEAKFKEINEAYQVLSDPQKKQQYDQFGQTFEGGSTGQGQPGFDFSGFSGANFDFSGMGDIFSDLFGGRETRRTRRRSTSVRGADIEIDLQLEFKEAVFGATKNTKLYKRVLCSHCHGNGAEPGTPIVKCKTCGGRGEVQRNQKTVFGQFAQITVCPACNGEGKSAEKSCSVCAGEGRVKEEEEIKIKIPAGIDHGQTLRVTGKGEAGFKGGQNGDLLVNVFVEKDDYFERDGFNILTDLPISFVQAALGDEVEVKTLDEVKTIKIPVGIQSGKVLRLKNKGVPRLGSEERGDQLINVRVITPQKLSRQEKKFLEELKKESGETAKVKKESLFKRMFG